tara:strand:- start:158 stop:649 length:492 start_codon:yes stop_codon:yes gene_type:complete
MATKSITVNINGTPQTGEVEDRLLLVHFIRDNCSLTGTHIGCDSTHCGACTVLLDGTAVKACTVFAVQADGRDVMTIEGMEGEALHPLQEAFFEEHALQCGFCTPGMIMSAKHLLDNNPKPTEKEIRCGISGNLCRCTGYQNIVKAVNSASNKLQESESKGVG